MNLSEYKEQIIQFASRLNGKPFSNYDASEKFTNSIYKFLDENYEIYLNANNDERKTIRQIIKDYDREEKDIREGDTTICSPFRYYANRYVARTIKNLKKTGHDIWLLRGLVVISIIDNIDYEVQNEEFLARLFVISEENGLNPKPIFEMFSEISSNEPAKLRNKSTSELIISTPNKAHGIVNQLRQWKVIE